MRRCLLMLAVILFALITGLLYAVPSTMPPTTQSATQPTTQPALKESKPVQVNGMDFQLVAPMIWVMPAERKTTSIPLALKITNHTDKAVTLKLFDTITLSMKDAAGKEQRMGGGRDGTRPCPPLLVEKNQSDTVDRTAQLQPVEGKPGQFRLLGSDGAGGIWYFDGLKPGRYTLRMAYESKDELFWVGKATTTELTFEITDHARSATCRQCHSL